MLSKIISGGQMGADIAALKAAKQCGLLTGGCVPNGCITEFGPNYQLLELYDMTEHESSKYPPRTFHNVKHSDGTLRFAANFETAGERCTLKAIYQYRKPYMDIDIYEPPTKRSVVDWIKINDIKVLNVAGNRESSAPGIEEFVESYLIRVFNDLAVEYS